MNYFFSLQYSAIQKTILRHDRLWSIAGISSGLLELNEIILPELTEINNGKVLVAGGGKFTATFFESEKNKAEIAKKAIIKAISTKFPMLEFQVSSKIIKASDLQDAKNNHQLIENLNNQKKEFRGYGVSFNPHMKTCEECGEYPAVKEIKHFNKIKNKNESLNVCTVCNDARNEAKIDFDTVISNKNDITTIKKIYQQYNKNLKSGFDGISCKIPYDFDDIFDSPQESDAESINRIAVWFSDINSMNGKVPIWLSQPNLKEIFDQVKSVYIEITANALARTFKAANNNNFLPFRIIVAGGDDLCIVMDEQYILEFACNLSDALIQKRKEIADNNKLDGGVINYLDEKWLNENKTERMADDVIKPYSFGASFVVTNIHTPFKQIHEVGEELMSEAKKTTDRWDNSINWRIMAEEHSLTDNILKFDKPLFIENFENTDKFKWGRLSFNEYKKLCKEFSNISSSHKHQIISKIITLNNDPALVENYLKIFDSSEMDKSYSEILTNPKFRDSEGKLVISRIVTLFELMSIKKIKGADNND